MAEHDADSVADRRLDRRLDRRFDLGIDTASDEASLAVFAQDEEQPLAVTRFRPEATMSRELIGAIAAFLAEAGVDRSEVARIAVTTGPGQYGPLRAGIAVAQGMALALEAPLAGVGRLEADAALAGPATEEASRVVVAVHATRSGPAWAAYEVTAGEPPREVVAPAITSAVEAARRAPRPAAWAGELDDALAAARDAEGRTGDTVVVTGVATGAGEMGPPRAVAIVRIARARSAFGDPAGVDAIYLRPPPITRPAPRE